VASDFASGVVGYPLLKGERGRELRDFALKTNCKIQADRVRVSASTFYILDKFLGLKQNDC